MTSGRKTALDALMKVNTKDGYSNIVLDAALKNSGLNDQDKALSAAIFYGVLEKKLTLDHFIDRVADKKPKLSPFVREALRSAAYQIVYMDKIPDHAAVHETVELVKKSRESRAAGLCNLLLRRISDRKGELTDFSSDEAGLALQYSVPEWLMKNLSADYGKEKAEQFFKAAEGTPPTYIRVNTVKTTTDSLADALRGQGINVQKTLLDTALRLDRPGSIEGNPLFAEGLFFTEDLASQLCVEVLSPRPGERILDLCAAPGGKSFATALKMENKGEVISCDLYDSRTGLIQTGAERLGLSIIRPMVNDGSATLPDGQFDRVLCDVPCSGFGIIRRKPDVKYKDPDRLKELPPLQLAILENGAKAVKSGGRLVYSTCTLRRSENQKIVDKFLKNHPEFTQIHIHINGVASATDDGCLTLMGEQDTDGFFVAAFEKK